MDFAGGYEDDPGKIAKRNDSKYVDNDDDN